MYLHAHRLELSTALEQLDISAGDPWPGTPGAEDPWTEQEAVCPLPAAYTAIHDQALQWTAFTCDGPALPSDDP
jgi:hypothetical protein